MLSCPPTPVGLSLCIAAPSFSPLLGFLMPGGHGFSFHVSLVSVDMGLLWTFSGLVPDLYTTVLPQFLFALYHRAAPTRALASRLFILRLLQQSRLPWGRL